MLDFQLVLISVLFFFRGRLKKRGPHDKAYNPAKLQEINVRRPYPFICGVLTNQHNFQPRSQPAEVQRHVTSVFEHMKHFNPALTGYPLLTPQSFAHPRAMMHSAPVSSAPILSQAANFDLSSHSSPPNSRNFLRYHPSDCAFQQTPGVPLPPATPMSFMYREQLQSPAPSSVSSFPVGSANTTNVIDPTFRHVPPPLHEFPF